MSRNEQEPDARQQEQASDRMDNQEVVGEGEGQAERAEEDGRSFEMEVESIRRELDVMKDKYLRSLADCQNIQKRAAAERGEAVARGQAEMARSLLTVLDNFERTVEAAQQAGDQAVAEGVRMVYDQMLQALRQFGLERMEVKPGDAFDPVHQQAVAHQPTDEVEPDHVLHVAQAGYMMKDKLLRAAAVVVAKELPQEQ